MDLTSADAGFQRHFSWRNNRGRRNNIFEESDPTRHEHIHVCVNLRQVPKDLDKKFIAEQLAKVIYIFQSAKREKAARRMSFLDRRMALPLGFPYSANLTILKYNHLVA